MTSCLRTVALVVGLCRIVKRHRLSFLNLALAVCWTRPQFTRNVRTDLIPAQSGSLLVSHIDDPSQEWAGFDLEIITRFLEETNPRPPSSLKTLGSVFFSTQPYLLIFNFLSTCNAYLYFLPVLFCSAWWHFCFFSAPTTSGPILTLFAFLDEKLAASR